MSIQDIASKEAQIIKQQNESNYPPAGQHTAYTISMHVLTQGLNSLLKRTVPRFQNRQKGDHVYMNINMICPMIVVVKHDRGQQIVASSTEEQIAYIWD